MCCFSAGGTLSCPQLLSVRTSALRGVCTRANEHTHLDHQLGVEVVALHLADPQHVILRHHRPHNFDLNIVREGKQVRTAAAAAATATTATTVAAPTAPTAAPTTVARCSRSFHALAAAAVHPRLSEPAAAAAQAVPAPTPVAERGVGPVRVVLGVVVARKESQAIYKIKI